MKRATAIVAAASGIVICVACSPGNVYFQKARKAELHKDWDTALVDYQKAAQNQPDNAEFQLNEDHARTQAALFHLKQGEQYLHDHRTDQALAEFQKALSINPGLQAAQQYMAQIVQKQASEKQARQKKLERAIHVADETAEPGVVHLKPLPQQPLAHFRISADSRRVYETLCQLAGLNVAFTSDFQARPVSLDLNNVKIADALQTLALQTNTFWRVVTPNTILVVPNNPANVRDYESEVTKTVFLANPLKPADRTAITTALKQILGIQKIIDNPDANAIIVRDDPKKVQEAVDLIHDLDHGKAEILIDITVLEADADRVRELGLTPATVSSQGSITNGAQGALVFNPASAASLSHLSTADYGLVVPSAVANAILNDTSTRILQNPEVRVTDGDTATLRIGSRVPFATGSFLPSLGVGGTTGANGGFGGLIANTQFQFQDVGVNVDLTPHLLPDGEVAIHAKIDISSVQPSVQIAGVNEPTFGQRQIEHDIRLKEGETSMLGGLLETTNTDTTSGLPGLSRIPGLRYFFSQVHHEKVQTDVLIMLTPRVIRLPEPGNANITNAAATQPPDPAAPGPKPVAIEVPKPVSEK